MQYCRKEPRLISKQPSGTRGASHAFTEAAGIVGRARAEHMQAPAGNSTNGLV
jgi:hypothetical protein